MNANQDYQMAKDIGLITDAGFVNWGACHVVLDEGGWTNIAKPYKDPLHGWCLATMWVKKDGSFLKNICLEKLEK